MQVFLNTTFVDAEAANVSIFDHGFLYGDGIYETLRTVNGKIFDFTAHYERLCTSAKLLQLRIPLSKKEIESATNSLLERNNFSPQKEARIRWTLTRGKNNFSFTDCSHPTFLITTKPLPEYSAEIRTNGVAVTTLPLQRILPQAKTTSLLSLTLGRQKAAAEKCFECIFCDNGFLLEGSLSNFFILDQKNKTISSAPSEYILHGTSARRAQKKAERLGYRWQEKHFTIVDAQQSSGAFLTNSLFGILPVTLLENKKIGDGNVGPFCIEVIKDFWES